MGNPRHPDRTHVTGRAVALTSHITPADERPHRPGDELWWCESWDFDFATPDAALGGYVRLDVLPNRGVCWYAAALVGPDRDPVVVADHEVAPPRPPGLEIRAHGLWADHIVEEPLDHVSVGSEAFALRLDTGADPLAVPLLGDPTPFGLDLGWETHSGLAPVAIAGSRPAVGAAPSAPGGGNAVPPVGADEGAAEAGQPAAGRRAGGYALACRVVGEVLVADDRFELDAFGWRRHTWGTPGEDGEDTRGHFDADGPDRRGSHCSVRGWLADGTWLCADGGDLGPLGLGGRVHPLAEAPLLVPGVEPVRLQRTLCRITAPDAVGVPGTAVAGVAWWDRPA